VRPCHGDLARRRQKRGDQGTSRDPPSGLPLFVALLLLTREETITMGMVKSIVIVTGANEANEPVTVVGEALQNLHFKPGQFVPVVEPNPAGGSQRTLVQLHPGFVAGVEEVVDKVKDLETTTDNLDTRVNNLEVAYQYAVAGGRWSIPPVQLPFLDGESFAASLGELVRVDIQNLGGADTFTVILPEVVGADLGRRICVAEVWGVVVGGGGPYLAVQTTAGQQIDFNISLPYQLTGSRPRVTFVVALISGPNVYGWTIESAA